MGWKDNAINLFGIILIFISFILLIGLVMSILLLLFPTEGNKISNNTLIKNLLVYFVLFPFLFILGRKLMKYKNKEIKFNERSYWFKGAFFSGGFFLFVFIIVQLFLFSKKKLIFIINETYSIIDIPGVYISNFLWDINRKLAYFLFIDKQYKLSLIFLKIMDLGLNSQFFQYITMFVSIIFYILIGALIGYLYGKFKNRNK